MNVETILACWSAACSETGLRWYLFRDTLLCAVGYASFPEALTCPQIAVPGEDLAAFVEKVFPALPRDWTVDKSHFARGKRTLIFHQGELPVLEISILCGVKDDAQLTALSDRFTQIARPVNKVRPWNMVCNLIPMGARTVGKPVRRHILRLAESVFPQLVELAAAAGKDASFYCDVLTAKNPVYLPADNFGGVETVRCGSIDYPVFASYRAYLEEVYGDYENGLTDEIGCGLTVEEKAELKAHQARCFEALTFLQELSQEFCLRYYLLAGSVLGCVRHDGFIPWDDDIDIGIRVEELERFEALVKEHLPARLPEGFTLVQSAPDTPYPRMFSKICYDGRCCIDLWPLVPTYNEGFRARLLWRTAKILTRVHYMKIGHPVTRFRRIAAFVGRFMTDRTAMTLARKNERKYVGRHTPAYINLYSIYRRQKETIQRRWLDTEATAVFNGLEVPVVGCTEEYLTHLYGNYMAKPAPWKRVSRHVARFAPTDCGCTSKGEDAR